MLQGEATARAEQQRLEREKAQSDARAAADQQQWQREKAEKERALADVETLRREKAEARSGGVEVRSATAQTQPQPYRQSTNHYIKKRPVLELSPGYVM